MPKTPVKTARDCNGAPVHVGDFIEYQTLSDEWGPLVEVVAMHRQGADGTILRTEPEPDPAYPHHFTCRASKTRLKAAKIHIGFKPPY